LAELAGLSEAAGADDATGFPESHSGGLPVPADQVVDAPTDQDFPGSDLTVPGHEPEPSDVAVELEPVAPEPADEAGVEPEADQVVPGDTVVVEPVPGDEAADVAVEPEPVEPEPGDEAGVEAAPVSEAPAEPGEASVAAASPRADLHQPSAMVPAGAGAAPSDDAEPRDEDEDEAVEPERAPGRPSTVPRVTLSWREAESFDIGLPSVDDDQEAIVVEPPSQLVARPRRRRPEPVVTDEDDGDVAGAAEPVEQGPADLGQESQPANDGSDDGVAPRSGRLRWILVVVGVLLVVTLLAWYFLLRGSGDGSAAPAGRGTASAAPRSGSDTPGFFVS
jgi:hypothetical protein